MKGSKTLGVWYSLLGVCAFLSLGADPFAVSAAGSAGEEEELRRPADRPPCSQGGQHGLCQAHTARRGGLAGCDRRRRQRCPASFFLTRRIMRRPAIFAALQQRHVACLPPVLGGERRQAGLLPRRWGPRACSHVHRQQRDSPWKLWQPGRLDKGDVRICSRFFLELLCSAASIATSTHGQNRPVGDAFRVPHPRRRWTKRGGLCVQ